MNLVQNSKPDLRKKVALKNMNFSRFVMFRYTLALMFFINLYWGVCLYFLNNKTWFIPILLMGLSVPAIFEQVKLNGISLKKQPQLKQTRTYILIQLLIYSFLMVSSMQMWGMSTFFPFIVNNVKGRRVVLVMLMIGIFILLLNLRKINKIKNNKDRAYQAIKDFEKHSER